MRLALLAYVAALALSGCVLPEDEVTEDPLLGVCPAWEDGAPLHIEASAADNLTRTIVAPMANGTLVAHLQGYPLDRYRIVFTAIETGDGGVRLRAFHDDTGQQRGIYDFRDDATNVAPFLTVRPDGFTDTEFDILLTSPEHGAEPMPGALRLEWTSEGAPFEIEADVIPGYRVCGAITAGPGE